jgi:hypothetical protein
MWLIDVSCPKNKKRKTEVFFLLFYIFLYSIFSFQFIKQNVHKKSNLQ